MILAHMLVSAVNMPLDMSKPAQCLGNPHKPPFKCHLLYRGVLLDMTVCAWYG